MLTADFAANATIGVAPFPVSFFDQSSGDVAVTAWEWDFGDGGTSTEQNPSHVFAAPGTYGVSLRVTSGLSFDTRTKPAYIRVQSEAASASVYNGSGVNSTIFTSLNSPVLGTTWTTQIDGGAVGASNGLTFVIGYANPLDPGVLLGVGELLVDVSSPFAVLNISVLVNGLATHNQAIPNDLALAGASITTQAIVNKTPSGKALLANALILVFGSV